MESIQIPPASHLVPTSGTDVPVESRSQIDAKTREKGKKKKKGIRLADEVSLARFW